MQYADYTDVNISIVQSELQTLLLVYEQACLYAQTNECCQPQQLQHSMTGRAVVWPSAPTVTSSD